jgi:hypothetical protein
VQIVRGTVKFAVSAISHTVALATNPVIWLIFGIVLIIIMLAASFMILFGGNDTNTKAIAGAVGFANENQTVNDVYTQGKGYFDTNLTALQNQFNQLIDNANYNSEDLPSSDLIFLRRTKADNSALEYAISFATDTRKTSLKSEWNFEYSPETILAICYVYLEKQAGGGVGAIVPVTLSEQIVIDILNRFINFNSVLSANNFCPQQNCTQDVIVTIEPNPEYTAKSEEVDTAYYDWQEKLSQYNSAAPQAQGGLYYGVQSAESEYYDLLSELSEISSSIEKTEVVGMKCDGFHELHSVNLTFNSKEKVMSDLGFSEGEIQWVDITEVGFQNITA